MLNNSSPSQFRMCSVCRNQRPATTLMLLPCCFRQSICLWCVAASVEVRNSVECFRCGGNFHGPFVSNEMSTKTSPGSLPQSPLQNVTKRNDLRHQPMSTTSSGTGCSRTSGTANLCNVSGCGRRALNEACYHCGAWLCPIDEFVHKEDLADKHIVILRMIIRRARDWQATFNEPTLTNGSFEGSVKFSPPNETATKATPYIGAAKQLDSIETVDLAKTSCQNSFACSKTEELLLVIERGEELSNLLETKRARRLDLRAIAAEITEMKRKVSFVEGVASPVLPPARPTNIIVPRKVQNPPIIIESPAVNGSVDLIQHPGSGYNSVMAGSPSMLSTSHTTNSFDQTQLNALISASNAEMSAVEKLKIAIAMEEQRLKERRKTLTPTAAHSPLPLLLAVQDIAANDPDKKKLFFHRVHGSNIVISGDGLKASRKDVTRTNGGNICFSSRPVAVNERIILTCLQSYPTSHSIEIGFTNHDPLMLTQDLPDSFCNSSWGRDEASWQPGFWIYIGRGILARETEQLSFCYNVGRQVIIVEGSGRTMTKKLPSTINLEQPVWAIIDLAGRPSVVSIRSGDANNNGTK